MNTSTSETATKNDLGERLRTLAAKGNLTHLSVVPLHRGKEVIWAASYAPAMGWGHGFGNDPDIVTAILAAIDDWKPTRKPREKPGSTAAAEPPAREPWE